MCGIWAWIHAKGVHVDTKKISKAVEHIVARGPEGTRIEEIGDATFAFTRLAINGLNPDGMQPFTQGSCSASAFFVLFFLRPRMVKTKPATKDG